MDQICNKEPEEILDREEMKIHVQEIDLWEVRNTEEKNSQENANNLSRQDTWYSISHIFYGAD